MPAHTCPRKQAWYAEPSLRRRAACLFVLVAILTAAPRAGATQPLSPSSSDKVIAAIKRKGYKRVAVLPQALVRQKEKRPDGEKDLVVKNTVGPLSTVWASELYEELVNASGEGFDVVPQEAVLNALNGRRLSDVGSEELWDLIMKRTGADSLVYPTVIDPGPEHGGKSGSDKLPVKLIGVDLSRKSAFSSQSRDHTKSLSDAAYCGESFVVREWKDGKIEATGLLDGDKWGLGLAAEREQYANLIGGLGHPIARDGFPYGVGVVVDGETRDPVAIDGRLFVPLSVGEKYQLRIWNRGEETTYAAVYIDGVNTIGQKRERPSDTDTNRTWWLRSTNRRAATIEGWFNHNLDTNQRAKVDEFVVVGADKSIARESGDTLPGNESFGASIGMITAIFYTYGTENIPVTRSAKLPPESSIGTGRGAAIDSRISGNPRRGDRDLPAGFQSVSGLLLAHRRVRRLNRIARGALHRGPLRVSRCLDRSQPRSDPRQLRLGRTATRFRNDATLRRAVAERQLLG